jgi:UDP-N-acetylmuramate dehydrogenase
VLGAIVGPDHVRRHAPLAGFTTFRVGGAADWMVEAQGSAELVAVVRAGAALGLPVTVLGGGSNVLVADAGVRGLVVRTRNGGIQAVDAGRVRADAGVTINGLVRWTVNRGLAGLEAWAGTPGTVGGAIYGNAHFRGRLVSEVVDEVRLLTPGGRVLDVPAAEMEFGYDVSRLQRTREVVLSAVFRVGPGDPAALREMARQSLAYRKQTQPLDTPSAGCIFQNPDPARDRVPPGIPPSAGALIDRAGLKGRRIGGARVSPTHGNFIVNEGGATASDVRALVELCRRSVKDAFGVDLREEIVCLGDFAHVEPVD